jgi:hypothetical protein
MKLIACIGIVVMTLLCCETLRAQSTPMEWRPSIAEDNKSATWEDTFLFLRNTMKDAHWEASGSVFDVVEITSPRKCQLLMHDRTLKHLDDEGVIRKYWDSFTNNYSLLDFNRVDALTIRSLHSQNSNSPGKDYITLEGTNNGEVVSWTKYSDGPHRASYTHYDAQAAIANNSELVAKCLQDPLPGCNKTAGSTKRFEIGDLDLELAHRISRALMHAALLCGGTKAVSPF